MKSKDLINLRNKNIEELNRNVQDKKLEHIKVSMDRKASKEKNLKKVKNICHEIAQILTLIREKELADADLVKKGIEE